MMLSIIITSVISIGHKKNQIIGYSCHFQYHKDSDILASNLSSFPCRMWFVFIIDLVPRRIYKAQADSLCFTDGTLKQQFYQFVHT